jgi:SAM-dependent methyltransferase
MKSNVELIEGDAMSLPFADNEFDVAMSVAVLEHLPDPRQGAAELRRVVRPGGHLVIGMPNWHSQYMLLKKMEMWLGGEIDYNTRIHTAHSYISIREMFRPYGFKELCALPIAPFSIPPSLLKLLPGSHRIERLILMAERGLGSRLAWLGQHVLFIFQKRVD